MTSSGQIQTELSDRYWHEYFQGFLDSLRKLDGVADFERDDRFFGHPDDRHIQYKVRIGDGGETHLFSRDGHRAYEFPIEFDKKETGYGIYYGCRAFVCEGDLREEVDILNREWAALRGEVCEVLDNTFPGKSFAKRFRLTNNTYDNTFWPFWITLDPGEDIVGVAARATRIIARIYRRYLLKTSTYHRQRFVSWTGCPTRSCFTKDWYDATVSEIRLRYGEESAVFYRNFIDALDEFRIITRDDRYEYAWRFNNMSGKLKGRSGIAGLTNRDIVALIGKFCRNAGLEQNKGGIPWVCFEGIFLRPSGTPFAGMKNKYWDSGEDGESADKANALLEILNGNKRRPIF